MNKRQKLIQERFLDNEDAVIKRLDQVYGQSLKDVTGKISDLDKSIGDLQKALADVNDDEIGDLAKAFLGRRANISPAEAKETLQSMLQSKVYQKRYQEALKGQIDGIMDKMHSKEYKVVSDYLKECYEDGFIGTMFDLQGQGIPLCFPLDQEAMVRAVQLDSKISQGLYSRLGEDVANLKKKITAQVSRGIATGMSFQQVARGLSAYTNIGYNNAVRIARAEGHRIQVQGTMDACYKAKEKGADVVKQWDSTLDGKTRESHSKVDGEIRELDKPFSNGLMYPGDPSGGAAEVVNCRCALLQRARWALDEAELETLQKRAEYFGLDKSETFEDYKKTYLKASENLTNSGANGKINNEFSNNLTPRGQLSHINEDDLYSSVARELNISEDQAIEYVDSTMGFTDMYFTSVRNYQRGEYVSPDDLADVMNISKNVEEYIRKAPRWNGGETFRGVTISDDELSRCVPGHRLNMGGTASWTNNQTVASQFAGRNETYSRPNPVVYHSETQNKGTGIQHISVFEHENEVLCSKDSCYEVVRTEKDANGITHIYLKEVEG